MGGGRAGAVVPACVEVSGPLVLRKWQAEAIPCGLAALDQRVAGVVVATTGAGKSIFLAELLRRWRVEHPASEGAIVVTTPSRKLVEQLAGTLADVLGAEAVGRYYTKAKQYKRDVIVCCNPSVPALMIQLESAGRPVAVWFADECHKTETDNFRGGENEEGADVGARAISATLKADRRLGMTATPFRSDEDERLTMFDTVVYRYPPAEALRDGVIVPWRVVGWGQERPAVEVDEACITMIQELGTRAQRGPGVVNATTIEDAEVYCARLATAGIVALPIHSRMKEADQLANVAAVRRGDVDCLVHVSMLVEGVDYPWLRWGCLRRSVGARVRFIQEVGRFLRADANNPAKTEAVLLDPHDLFGAFQITYEAALGWVDPEDEEDLAAKAEEKECREEDENKKPKPPKVLFAARTTALSRYVRQMHLALIAEGVCSDAKPFPAGGWRNDPASAKQTSALGRMARVTSRLAAEHRRAVQAIASKPEIVTKGIASDLMDLLVGVGKLPGGKVWEPASPVRLPPEAAFLPVTDPAVYVAGGMRGGWSGVAVIRGREVLYAGTRPWKRGDTWGSLTMSGMRLAVDRYGAAEVVSSLPDVVASVPNGVVGRLCMKADNPAERRVWAELANAGTEGAA